MKLRSFKDYWEQINFKTRLGITLASWTITIPTILVLGLTVA